MDHDLESLSKAELIALLQAREKQLGQQEKTLREQKQQSSQQQKVIARQEKQFKQQEKNLAEQQKVIQEQEETLQLYAQQLAELKKQVVYYKRKFFGRSRERFTDPNQLLLPLFANAQAVQKQVEILKEKITYERKKGAHPGRLKLPENLRVEEIHLHPEGDLSEMVCIGQEITEELEHQPEEFFIRKWIRHKYAPKSKEGSFAIAPLPERVIDKGIPGPVLLSSLLINKYVDHLPLYRQKQRFTRAGIQITSSTLEAWVKQSAQKLLILYEYLREDIRSKGYLQVDESPIKVLDHQKKGKAHQGYYWFYHSPLDGMVFIEYHPTRGKKAPMEILRNFTGYLQSDGYAVYDAYAQREQVIALMCWAHVRRKFFEAKDNDAARAEEALTYIQAIYTVEQLARESQMSSGQRFELRLSESVPFLHAFKEWLTEQQGRVTPGSPLGKAIAYTLTRWNKLNHYLLDGSLEIDNNLVENLIRPLALGRKNYLFAGSHEAAQRAAAIYTFMALCKKHEVNPQEWLSYTLQNIMTISHKNIRDLYPQNFRKRQENP